MSANPLSRSAGRKMRAGAIAAGAAGLTAGAAYLFSPVRTDLETIGGIVLGNYTYAAQLAAYIAKTQTIPPLPAAAVLPLAQVGLMTTTGLIAVGYAYQAAKIALKPKEYGESEYAGPSTVRRMPFGSKHPPVLGNFRGKRLMAPECRQALCIAPTRTGKTRGTVIPSILAAKGSVIVLDPKGELTQLTKKARAKLGPTYEIDWANPASPDSWSPIGANALPINPVELERHVERIAAMLYPERKGQDPHWSDNARRNFTAITLFEIYQKRAEGKEARLGDIVSLIVGGTLQGGEKSEDPFGDHLLQLAAEADLKGYPARIREDLQLFAQMHPKERSSHLTTLITGLQLLRVEAVRKSTSTSTFTFDDLRKRPSTLYIRFPQKDAEAFGRLTALFLENLFGHILDTPLQSGDHSIFIVADEFASLPKIPLLLEFLEKGAGQKAHILIVLQDYAQLVDVYGETGLDRISTNIEYTVVLQQNNGKTQERLSKLVGQKSRRRKTTSGTWLKPFAPSISESVEGVPLIRPEEWGTIPFGKQIVVVKGWNTNPVLCDCAFYDKDRDFRGQVSR